MKMIHVPKNTVGDAMNAIFKLHYFIGKNQILIVKDAMNGEEKQYFIDKMIELAGVVGKMPKTYEQDGLGDMAIVHLHYFKGGCDWYITEKDKDSQQAQAFGYANLGDDNYAEVGYISLEEILESNVELDFHWKPKTLAEVMGKSVPATDQPTIPARNLVAGQPTIAKDEYHEKLIALGIYKCWEDTKFPDEKKFKAQLGNIITPWLPSWKNVFSYLEQHYPVLPKSRKLGCKTKGDVSSKSNKSRGDRPEPGKQYNLTSFRSRAPSIANGNSWKESEVKPEDGGNQNHAANKN